MPLEHPSRLTALNLRLPLNLDTHLDVFQEIDLRLCGGSNHPMCRVMSSALDAF